jgi:hypothetical protein
MLMQLLNRFLRRFVGRHFDEAEIRAHGLWPCPA